MVAEVRFESTTCDCAETLFYSTAYNLKAYVNTGETALVVVV